MGECEEERDVLDKCIIDGCDMEKFGTLGISEKTIAICEEAIGGHRRPKGKEIR